MHEVGLMQTALDLAVATAKQHHARCIHRIRVRVGAMAGVDPEAMALAFEVVKAGTIAADACLEVDTVSVICVCPDCQATFFPTGAIFECPTCGGLRGDIRAGRELELASVEVSNDADTG